MQNNILQANTPQAIAKGLQLFAKAQELHAAKQYAAAAAHYKKTLSLMPDHPNVLVAYAQLAEEVKDWPSAEKLYRKIGALRPNSNFEVKLAGTLFQQERYADSIPLFEKYIEQNPEEVEILHALGNSLCMVGRSEEGLAMARRAHALNSDEKYTDTLINALYHLARIDELDKSIADALKRFPDSRKVRSMYAVHKLKSGDYDNGFRYFEDLRWRNNIQRPGYDETTTNDTWDGTPFDGLLVIAAEQGLGDEIMLSSMFSDLLATGQEMVIACDQRLIPLYQRSFPDMMFVPRRGKTAVDGARYKSVRRITALDVAHVFRRQRANFPERRQWLSADARQTQALRTTYQTRWPGKKLVGISWKSTRVMEGMAIKSVDIEDFSPLLTNPDCIFVSLQYGDVTGDVAQLREQTGCEIFVDPDIDSLRDIDGYAAQISALDLVISISNTAVHVAGALGVPCWLLLPKARPILWYWGYQGDTTPWYPSLHLMRNTRNDNWKEFTANIATQLTLYLDKKVP